MKADLNLWMSAVSNDTPINISAYQLSKSWDENQASWNYSKTSPLTSWSVKGGDYTSTVLSSMEVGNQIDLAYSQKWDIPVGLINKWVTNPTTNNGIILKSNSESTNTYKKFISSEYPIDGQYQPLLVITYKTGARLGIEDYWEYDSHSLVGGTSYTNLTTGNNIIQYQDFTLPSRGGFGLDFNRTYNSKSQENSIFGYGWTATGLENLYVGSNNIDYTDEDGTTHKFTYDDASALYKSEAGKYLTIKKSSESINNKYVYYYELQDKYGNKKIFKIDEFNNDTDLTLATLQYWEDRHGNRINFEYNSNHQLIKITSDLGNGLVKSIELSYNTDGYVESVSYEGSKFTYSYKNDQLISMNQLKSDGTYSVTQFEYKDNRISAIIDPNGRRTDFTYQNEMLTKVQEPQEINGVKDPGDRPGTEYSIDIANKCSIITYPEGNHETFYSNDQYVTIKKIDSDGMETTYTLDENYNPTAIIEDGHPTTNTYDNKGNLTSTTDPEHHTISYEYTTFSNIAKIIDSNQNPTFYTYNAKGDLLSIKYPDTGTETYQYDSYGDLQSVTHPDTSTENIKYDYNTNQKTVESIDPFLNKTKSVADHQGNLLERTDGKGNPFTYSYDEKNELTEVSDPNQKTTRYEYDPNGNITKITNSKNKETNFEYDGQNNLQKEKNALGEETRYQYDLNGNLEKTILPNDHNIINHYDYSVDQLKSIEVNGTTMWGFGYDSSGNVTTVCKGGYPCQGSDVLKTISYKDDGSVDTIVDRGNPINYTDLGTKQVLKYQVGNQTSSIEFLLNPMNQLSSISRNGETTPLAAFDYEKGGLPKLVKYKNGSSIEMYYDHNRLNKYVLNSNTQEPLDTFTFQYDANNNITKIDSKENGVTSYTYDDKLDQLRKEELPDGTTISYEYDEVGNRVSKSITKSGDTKVTQYSYNDANQLVEAGEKSYQYDKNGNLKNDGSKEYIFNDLNQLEEIKDQTGKSIAKYTYDEEGKRISSTTGTGTIHYFYNGNQVIYETNSENQTLREYTYNDAGQPLTMTLNGNTYYYLYNQHGDVIALTDENSKEVASYTYDAWGNVLTQSGDLASENPYRYAGYRYDENTHLYYLLARYYNPETGVFLSLDPVMGDIQNPITLNGYNYANNNPVMFFDPDGELAIPKKVKKVLRSFINYIFNDFINNTVTNILLIAVPGGINAWLGRKMIMKEGFSMIRKKPYKKMIFNFITGGMSGYGLGQWGSDKIGKAQYVISKFFNYEKAFDKLWIGKKIDSALRKTRNYLLKRI
ncbi:hypothetical protein J19TS1_43970 [Heyndrickxia oleronia]|nr:hypothetical protein J19TS1_43970 [Heyndrickxia oleronia]